MIPSKRTFLLILGCFFFAAVNAQGKYTINGSIAGKANGMKVYLVKESLPEAKVVDSTVIKDNRFKMKGSVKVPSLYSIRIDKTPKGEKSSQRNWLSSRFYLDNSVISYSGDVDSLPPFYYSFKNITVAPVIKGSATQDESVKFNEERAKFAKINNGKKSENISNDFTWNYIKSNPSSVISYDQAFYLLNGMYANMTVSEIDGLISMIRKGWAGTPQLTRLENLAEKAKAVALGTAIKDFKLTNEKGEQILLSEYIPKGKIVMLEFWASWCGPCRGEIPHLKELNKTRSNLFSIISISLDDNEKEWRKALEFEKMDWPQLVDYNGVGGQIAQAYNIMAIPYSIILDGEGRIMKIGLRGDSLDAFLNKLEKERL